MDTFFLFWIFSFLLVGVGTFALSMFHLTAVFNKIAGSTVTVPVSLGFVLLHGIVFVWVNNTLSSETISLTGQPFYMNIRVLMLYSGVYLIASGVLQFIVFRPIEYIMNSRSSKLDFKSTPGENMAGM